MQTLILDTKGIVGRRPLAARVSRWPYFRCALTAAALVSIVVVPTKGQISGPQDELKAQDQENAAPARRVVVVRNGDLDGLVSSLLRGKDVAQFQFESILKMRVEMIAHRCALTETQMSKLLVAGRGDIKHFFDRVEEISADLDGDADDRNEFRQFLKEVWPPRVDSRRDVFGEGSIFSKVFKTTLTAEQSALFEKVPRDRALARHQATIAWVASKLETLLELSPDEQRQLEVFLREHTRPPRYFAEHDDYPALFQASKLDYYGVLFQASKLPENKLRSVVSERHWAKLSNDIAESKRLLPILQYGGFVPENDVAAVPESSDRPRPPTKKRG
jgi:hypothetical protein